MAKSALMEAQAWLLETTAYLATGIAAHAEQDNRQSLRLLLEQHKAATEHVEQLLTGLNLITPR